MYIHDSHIHTEYSFDSATDGSAKVYAVIEAAIAAGIDEITLCDHCDIDDILYGIYPEYPAEKIRDDVLATRERYKGKIRVNFGIELGEPHARPVEANELLDRMGYDFVIGSLHNLREYPDFAMLKYEMMTTGQLDYIVRRMTSELCEIIDFGRISTLAHITYIKRYLSLAGVEYDLAPYHDSFAAMFDKLIKAGISLEVNTSGLRRGSVTMPDRALLALYRECGGEKITLGSDAHTSLDVGKGIEEAAAMLRALGFRSQTVVRDGKLTEIEL